ncbi:hypothetical protein GLOIN_2v1649104, partial [Rhizophagus irregularis DAOM 181602=DAOM 197198]
QPWISIYTVLFRNNKFDEYVDTIFRLWCMMRRFQRYNYDKILPFCLIFPLGALPLGYHSPVPPNMKKFGDKNFCRNSTNKEDEVLICGYAYHEECFRVLGLKCEHCYKYLDKSIDELTKSYNQRLHLEETQIESNINEEMDEDSCKRLIVIN